jgi:Rrf2 family iron-sulfur cluster assembly transcriptional regulator
VAGVFWSSGCDYAIRACVHLAGRGEALVPLRELTRAESLPAPFAGKVLQTLVRAGLLRSVKGRHGGYGLARPPDEISLLTLLAAVDGTRHLDRCVLGLSRCSDESVCPLHDSVKPLRHVVGEFLASTTLAAMSSAQASKRMRQPPAARRRRAS